MRVFFNEDWIHFLWTRYTDNIEITPQVLKEFIYQYKGTDITDFVMNVNGTVSTFPSKVLESFSDKYTAKSENGFPVDYTDTYAKSAYNLFVKENTDMYSVWIEALREVGISPWISVRMNDCHDNFENTSIRKSSQVEKHPEFWRTPYRTPDYFGKCLNYALPEVSKMMLDYISEALERYDVDGLELDFMREMVLFVPGHEECNIITEFMKSVKSRITDAEQKYGHKIKLSVIVATEPEVCFEAGLDVKKWAELGLIDMVCIIPRWETITTNVPIEFWKSILGKTPLSVGQQILVMSYRGGYWPMSNLAMAYGQAYSSISRGADCVYLYNYMDGLDPGLEIYCHDTAIRRHQEEFLKNLNESVLRVCERRFPLTFNDYLNYWSPTAYSLPIEFKENEQPYFRTLRISTGDLRKDTALLQLGIYSAEKLVKDDFEVYSNGIKGEFTSPVPDKNICKNDWYAFKLNSENIQRHTVIELLIKKPCMVEYMEITATKKD